LKLHRRAAVRGRRRRGARWQGVLLERPGSSGLIFASPKYADLRPTTRGSCMHIERFVRALAACAALLSIASLATAQSTPNVHTATPQSDPGVYSGRLKVDYPTPYELAKPQDIRTLLERVHAYVSEAAPVRVVNGDTGEAVTDLSKLPPQVALARTDLQIVTYEWGVTYAGMLLLSQVTGDARYRQYTDERVTAIA